MNLITKTLAVLALAAAPSRALPYTPVVTPNGSTLEWKMEKGVKVFRMSVDACKHEISPGMVINAWCYNGKTPGPTIEAVEGDRVRILVTNNLPEATAVHWHGLLLPSGMDGVSGLNQRGIEPGETFAYEFTLKQNGTQMYHSHGDEMVQIGMGAMGFFIIHPKVAPRRIDRDYAIFLNEWFIQPGAATPNVSVMTDFNLFTFNSKAFPGTAPLAAKAGERVRLRFGNVGQESHPIHLHGHSFKITATDGGQIPVSAQWPETTVVVFPGQTRDVEFTAIAGDWAMHCHRRHHPMNAMGHDVPNLLGVNQKGVEEEIQKQIPDYMAMGETGMEEHTKHLEHMPGPANTLPMMTGKGPFGGIHMGGMFTVLKVRGPGEKLDAEWHANAAGTVADLENLVPTGRPAETVSEGSGGGKMKPAIPVAKPKHSPPGPVTYTCPMHPKIRSDEPGRCPKCGMDLVPEKHKH